MTKMNIFENAVKYYNINIEKINNYYVILTRHEKNTIVCFYDLRMNKISSIVVQNSYLEFTAMFHFHGLIGDRSDRSKFYIIEDRNFVVRELGNSEGWGIDVGWSIDDSNFGVSSEFLRLGKILDGKVHYRILNMVRRVISKEVYVSLHFIKDFVFSYKDLIISRFDPETLEILWKKDYTDELTHFKGQNKVINPIIGLYENIFIFGYQSDWLYGIDIESGNIIWKVNEYWNRSHIMEDGKLFQMGNSKAMFLDIATGKHIGEFGPEESVLHNCRMNYAFSKNHVFINGEPSDTIGAFNMKSYEFDWIYKEEGTQWSGLPQKYYHPYLFANDFNGNLHVFKVEDEMNLK